MTLRIFLEKLDRKIIGYRIKINEFFSTRITYLLCYIKGVEIGEGCRFIGIPLIRKAENSKIILGNNIVLRSDKKSLGIGLIRKCIITTINCGAEIKIDDYSSFSGAVIASEKSIIIGKRVLGGANCTITDTDWHSSKPEERHKSNVHKAFKVIIEDNVWLGYSSLILKGVTIGENSIISPLSVVIKNIPSNVIAAGNPALIVKEFYEINNSR